MSVTVDFQDLTQIVRIYGEGSYEEKSPFSVCATIVYHSKEEITLVALHGDLSKEAYVEVWNHLYDKGIRVIHSDRHNISKTTKLNRRR